MTEQKENEILAQTLVGVARNIVEHPLESDAEGFCTIYPIFLDHWKKLRKLPLKDVEPSVTFAPEMLQND